MSEKRCRNKSIIIAAFLLCLVAAWIYVENNNAKAVRPASSGTLMAMLQEPSQIRQIRKFVHNGRLYLEVIGIANFSPLSLPSGPPAYIFDETGALVDWCRDLGDNPSFVRKWGSFTNSNQISAEEAKQLVKRRAP